MSSNDASKATAAGFVIAEDSETMVEIKIKTLDSQTYTLRVDKCVSVPALKEQIAIVTGVLSEQQRLICRGKVLKDDQLLSAYHVEDGHTLHLVVRQPHQSASTSYMESEDASSAPGNAHNHGSSVAHSFVFESVNVDQEDADTSIISRILSSMFDSIGATSTRTGPTATGVRETISERLARASSDNGLSDSSGPNPNPANPYSSSSRRQTNIVFPSSVPSVLQNPPVIPDALTTLNQYISLMEDEFRREGFGCNASEQIDDAEATGFHFNERASHSHAPQGGLPSPASLAEILLSTRRLLIEQTGGCLSQLARQLEGHTSITDPLSRMNMQSGAIRSGMLMRNLGSLLLELGRTTMTLRMGQTPAEAIVNAGPANFISATGPNPLMVQAVPFYPGPNVSGMQMGPANSGHGIGGEQSDPAFIPTRNIEIRIRTAGRAVPIATSSTNEAAAGQQQQEQTDPARNLSGASGVHRAFTGGESGVRVVPLRTVVAVPSGVNSSPSDSSANPVRLFYPLMARVRPQTTGNASDSRGFEASSQLPQGVSEFDWLSLNQSARQREHLESSTEGAVRSGSRFPANIRPFGSGLNPPANESAANQGNSNASFSSWQSPQNNNSNRSNLAYDTPGGSGSHGTESAGGEQGIFFSNFLRQVMPFITQGREQGASTTNPSSSTAEIERENLVGSSSSQRPRDPPESPSAKRMKKND